MVSVPNQARQWGVATIPRVAPRPITTDMSFRAVPEASFTQISKVCDHWLAKSKGYHGPASRNLFEMAHEIKALLEPLSIEEARRHRRLKHLEALMVQWDEVFGQGYEGDARLRTPLSLWQALHDQDARIAALEAELHEAYKAYTVCEENCRENLARHNRAHCEEGTRQAMRHAEALEHMRVCAATQLAEARSHALASASSIPRASATLRDECRQQLAKLSTVTMQGKCGAGQSS
jgi:hypothetical protein